MHEQIFQPQARPGQEGVVSTQAVRKSAAATRIKSRPRRARDKGNKFLS